MQKEIGQSVRVTLTMYLTTYFAGEMAMENLEAVLYAYGVETVSVEDIERKIDPGMRGFFSVDAHNMQILLNTNMSFSYPKDLLNNLRQASKCPEEGLLSPIPFAAYICETLAES